MSSWKGKFVVKSHNDLSIQFPILSKYDNRVIDTSFAEDWIYEVDLAAQSMGYEVVCWCMVPNEYRMFTPMVTFKYVRCV
ncbi:hypothetical protein [Aeromonas phage 65.2]|nr:hypothetical protein [Aeromonas phage 65.2]